MAQLIKAFEEARPLLNDSNASPQRWTDAILLKFVPKAHRELQLLLWKSGIRVLKKVSAIITVNAGDLLLMLPSDLVEPISLGERLSGSSNEFDPMKELSFSNVTIQQNTTLRFWDWREENINFVGATTDRDILLRYTKGITIPTGTTSPIGFIFGESYLGPRIAALAAASVGGLTQAEELTNDANQWIEQIVSANVNSGQSKPIKRTPYRRGRRRGFIV